LLVVRLLAASMLLAVGRAARRSERPERLAFAAVAIVCATIEVCVFATGGVRSPYLSANVLVFAGIGILLPITTRQAVGMYATALVIAVAPILPGLHRVDLLPLATATSYLMTVAILGVAGARLQDNLRRGEHGARIANGDLRDVVVHEEVDQALTLVAQRLRSANVTVVREYAPNTPLVSCQPTLLGQVLVNLILNAVDAMAGRKDSRLTLRVR